MSVCLFPGKFQPFHTGHLMVIQGMVKTCDRVVIPVCVGKDPMFFEDEVREMISAALLAENILDAEIVVVSDCGDDTEWADKILEVADTPLETVQVWSGNEDVLALFQNVGVAVKKITHVPGHDGEEIRIWIRKRNNEWMKKVPAGAIDVVAKHAEKM